MLQVENMSMRFGDLVALHEVDLAVRPNTVHAIIGPNGAGKTTLFNILTGRLRPTSGRARYRGREITGLPVHRRVRLGISRSFQITSVFQELTVRENVRLAAQGAHSSRSLDFWRHVARQRSSHERADAVLERVGLDPVAGVLAGELSHGRQRILEVAMALAPGPQLMLLDEPTSGMGVEDIDMMQSLLTDLGQDHTLVVIEHNMTLTMRVADRISVLVGGEVLTEGTPDDIRRSPAVQKAYLGGAH